MPAESPEIKNLVAALASAQLEFTPVEKKKIATVRMKTGGEYKYNYADLADVLAMALPCLAKHKLALSQPHVMVDGHLRVCTRLMHASGEWIMSDGVRLLETGDPKDFGSQDTYYRRYDACSMLGIAPDDDTDVNTMHKPEQQKAREIKQPERRTAEPVPGAEFRTTQDRILSLGLTVAQIRAKGKEMFPDKEKLSDLSEEELEKLYIALQTDKFQPARTVVANNPGLQKLVDAGVVKLGSDVSPR